MPESTVKPWPKLIAPVCTTSVTCHVERHKAERKAERLMNKSRPDIGHALNLNTAPNLVPYRSKGRSSHPGLLTTLLRDCVRVGASAPRSIF